MGEIIKTVENPGGYDLTKVGVDKINPKVVYKIFPANNTLGQAVAYQKSPYYPNIKGPYGVSNYIGFIQKYVQKYNTLLKKGIFQTVPLPTGSKQTIEVVAPLKQELDWRWVAAMIMVETNPGTGPGYLRDARIYDPMQIGNVDDPAIAVLREGKEATNFRFFRT